MISILNNTFISTDSTTFANWTIGANGAWTPTMIAPINYGATGAYSTPPSTAGTDNYLTQTGVFTDFDSGTEHTIKIEVAFAINGFQFNVLFGTVTAGTISFSATSSAMTYHYITSSAATSGDLSFDMLSGYGIITYVRVADMDVLETPALVVPMYNPWWFTAYGINVFQSNYEYIFDVYTGATVTGSYLTRSRLQAYPDGTDQSYFSPFGVIESYLSFDRNIQNITSGTASQNHINYYTIDFGEAYGASSTGQTIYSGLTYVTGLTWNGVVKDQEEYNDFTYTTYNLSGATSKFLTHQPRAGVKVKNDTDRGTVTFMSIPDTENPVPPATGSTILPKFFGLRVYQNSGGTTVFSLLNPAYSGASPNRYITHIPAGPYNLNNMPPALFQFGSTGTGTTINICTDYKYEIQVFDEAGQPISEILTYLIDSKNSQFDTTRMKFKNSLGGFDYYSFNRIQRKNLSVDSKTFRKPLLHNFQRGDRGNTVYNVEANYNYTVYSDYLSYSESVWLEELLYSTDVEIVTTGGTTVPIIIDTKSIDVKPHNYNNKLMYYTFNYTPANSINTTRN